MSQRKSDVFNQTSRSPVILLALICIAGLFSADATAQPSSSADGWISWQVPAVEGAPNWCCFHWNSDQAMPKTCNLDSRNISYGNSGDADEDAEQMQIYAFIQDGELKKLRTLEASCPVKAKTEIVDLGVISAADSVNWLAEHISPHSKLSSHVLGAVAVHAGQRARTVLVDTARSNADTANRKDAVFWMGQVRAVDTQAELRQIMFNDASAKVREHAAFSMSQSDIPGHADSLIELANTDSSAKVRAQAWFWLTQTAAEESESAIFAALDKETDRQVQHQAIFALSQLPDERALRALTRVIENKNLSRDNRKQALFWLAQSDSPSAFEYMDSMLSDL